MIQRATFIAIGVLMSWLPAFASAENWTQFRGSDASGIVREAKLPVEWSADKQILWKVALPGVGWSQPVVWGDKVFVTTAESDEQAKPDPKNKGPGGTGKFDSLSRVFGGATPTTAVYKWKVLCLDAATGKTLWEKVAHEGQPTIPIHDNNTYASETPITDGERVIAYFGPAGLYCYDLAGNLEWKKDFEARRIQFGWGTGSSPILFGDKVYIQSDNDEDSCLIALDKHTGDELWRAPRDEKSNWSTPYIWKNKLRTELVTAGGNRMRSYDPETGKELWSLSGSGRTATTPIGDDEMLFVDSYDRLTGLSGQLLAIRPGASGDISLKPTETSNEFVAWSMPIRGGRMSSPSICAGNLYVLENGGGMIRCIEAKTGKQHYRKRIPDAGGFTSSPITSGNKVYCTDQNCKTFVLEAGPDLNVLATNDLGEMCWSSPAVAGNILLLRTTDHLYAIGTN